MKGCMCEIRLPAAACPPDTRYTTRPSHTPPPLWESWHPGLHASQERPNPETNDLTIPIVMHDATHALCSKHPWKPWLPRLRELRCPTAVLLIEPDCLLLSEHVVAHSNRAIEHVARIISAKQFRCPSN